MELYFVLNVLISLAAVFALSADKINHQVKLLIGFSAAICWFLPIHWLSLLREDNLFIPIISELVPNLYFIPLQFPYVLGLTILQALFIFVLGVGLIKFLIHFASHRKQINFLRSSATNKECRVIDGISVEIVTTNTIKGAITSGILKPTIWLGTGIVEQAIKEAAIVHEVTHIKHNDPLKLMLLHMFECLMWWNPIALLLVSMCKQQLELRCDDVCKQKLGLEKYRQHLAKLVLTTNDSDLSPLATRLSAVKGNFNIIRIKKLANLQPLNWLDYLRYIALTLLMLLLILSFVRSGQTGLDGVRKNKLIPVSASTFDIQIEQMPLRSLGVLASYSGIEDAFIHWDVLNEFYYLKMNDASWHQIVRKVSKETIAIAFIKDNKLYVAPDRLGMDTGWVSDESTTHFSAAPKEKQISWEWVVQKQKLQKAQTQH